MTSLTSNDDSTKSKYKLTQLRHTIAYRLHYVILFKTKIHNFVEKWGIIIQLTENCHGVVNGV